MPVFSLPRDASSAAGEIRQQRLLVSITNEVASPSFFQQFSDITRKIPAAPSWME
jgi:hypothetical protein